MKRQLLSRSHLLCILSLLFVSQVHGACTKIIDAETREACQNAEQRAADKEVANKKVYMAYKQHLQNNSFFTPIKALLPNSSFRLEIGSDQVHFHVQRGNILPFWKQGKKMAESVVNDINITLTDVYNGYTKPANWIRTKVCPICQGRGMQCKSVVLLTNIR